MKTVSFHNHPLTLDSVSDKRFKKNSSMNCNSMNNSTQMDNDANEQENNFSDSTSNSVSSTSKADSTFEHI